MYNNTYRTSKMRVFFFSFCFVLVDILKWKKEADMCACPTLNANNTHDIYTHITCESSVMIFQSCTLGVCRRTDALFTYCCHVCVHYWTLHIVKDIVKHSSVLSSICPVIHPSIHLVIHPSHHGLFTPTRQRKSGMQTPHD